jgi:hypothetical protein
MTKIGRLPRNTNTPVRSSGIGRPRRVAHIVNLGRPSADPMKLARHLKAVLPDWARRKK